VHWAFESSGEIGYNRDSVLVEVTPGGDLLVSISEGENPDSIVSFLPVAKWSPPTLRRISLSRNTAITSKGEQGRAFESA
jgi:hypothetical protein